MSDDQPRPRFNWTSSSLRAEFGWALLSLGGPWIAACIVTAFFARSLAYTPVPITAVQCEPVFTDRGPYSGTDMRYHTALRTSYTLSRPSAAPPTTRATTTDFMLYSHEPPALTRELTGAAATLRNATEAYYSPRWNEAVLTRGMHWSALPLVFLSFALVAGTLASWTRIFWTGLPPSQRAAAAVRNSLVRLLAARTLVSALAGITAFGGPTLLGFFPSSVVGLGAFALLDVALVYSWYRGALPKWSGDL